MSDLVSFSRSQADRIAGAVRAVERSGSDLRGNFVGPANVGLSFLAKITDADGLGYYSWRRQVFSGPGDVVDDSEGVVGELSAREINFLIPDTDSIVELTFAGYDEDDVPQYTFSIGWRKQGFNVYVTQDGGSAGDDTSPCTFTYTVKDAWGNTLATAKAVSHPRPALGAFVKAPDGSRAVAFRTGLTAGDLTLWQVAEVVDPEAC